MKLFSQQLSVRALAAGIVFGIGLTAVTGIAQAGEIVPSSMPAYQAAVAQGKPIVFHVQAAWCPVCARQSPVIAELMTQPEFKDYVVLKVDFDQDKRALDLLKVQQQSTLIVNKGATEVARATGTTDPAEIRALLLRASR